VATAQVSVLIDSERLDGALIDALARLELRESDAEPGIATLRFKLVQRPNGEYTPIDDPLFAAGAKLAVEIGAPGGNPLRLFDGFVTHVRPHFEEIETNCYVEVIGMDAAVLMDAEERAATYPNVSDKDAAAEILGRYSIPLVADDTDARWDEDHQLLTQRATDWSFLKRLARRNGFACYLEYDESKGGVAAYFRKPARTDNPQPDLTIQRDNANLRWLDLQFTMTGPVATGGAAIDPVRKRLVRGNGGSDAEPAAGDDAAAEIEGGLTDAGASAATALLRDAQPDDAAIAAEGRAATDRVRQAVEARGELDPALYRGLLRSRRPVLVKGVGARFSGTYYVSAVRTVLDQGELTQTFIATRNALGQSGSESFGQSAEEVPPA
jgi:phage protein D